MNRMHALDINYVDFEIKETDSKKISVVVYYNKGLQIPHFPHEWSTSLETDMAHIAGDLKMGVLELQHALTANFLMANCGAQNKTKES